MSTYTVNSGKTATWLTLNRGDILNNVGGNTRATIINNGGTETITSGGIASNTSINDGGFQFISEDGIANGTVITGGGYAEVFSGGIARGTIVNSGIFVFIEGSSFSLGSALIMGGLDINSGGIGSGTIINNGGIEHIFSGGIANGTVVNSGGYEEVYSAGITNGAVINKGGTQFISSGGLANGTVITSGGSLSFESSVTMSNISIYAGATLNFKNNVATSASINKFNQLVITSGSTVLETIGLTGNYSGINFGVNSDGYGGTLITEVNPTGSVANFLSKLNAISDSNKYIIVDTSSNIATNLNALQNSIHKLAIITKLNGLNNSSNFPTQASSLITLSITPTQSLTDNAVLAKISGAYNLTVTGTSAADKLYDTVNSLATLTGGKGIDTFNVTGLGTITDLGKGGADILKVSIGGIANASINTAWTATADTINNGTVNISTAGLAVNLSAVTKGTSGFKIKDTGGATKLIGSALGDLIIGGTGNDTLTGGKGDDFFVFNTQINKNNVDLITDFVSGKDHLQLSKAIFAGLNTDVGTGNGTVLKASEFVSSKTATQGTTTSSHLIYNSTTGALYYDADGNGKGAAVEVAILGTTLHPALVASDILVIA